MIIKKWDDQHPLTTTEQNELVDFLYTHLQEYGDKKKDIASCLNYAMNRLSELSTSGTVFSAYVKEQLAGVAVVNETGMKDYIPENILVYIATHNAYRGQGIASGLIKEVISTCKGNIALHVEHENPAKKLYEKLGFTNKYSEMRFIKN